jgi:L-ascorbate metabolism protein UlaG (beta-lactamase superfamily)
MKIQFFGYNAFLIESGNKLLAIDLYAFYTLLYCQFSPRKSFID